MGGGGSTYDYGFRIYNPALGKFLSTDPLSKAYSWNSPYAFAENTPICAIDLDGLEKVLYNRSPWFGDLISGYTGCQEGAYINDAQFKTLEKKLLSVHKDHFTQAEICWIETLTGFTFDSENPTKVQFAYAEDPGVHEFHIWGWSEKSKAYVLLAKYKIPKVPNDYIYPSLRWDEIWWNRVKGFMGINDKGSTGTPSTWNLCDDLNPFWCADESDDVKPKDKPDPVKEQEQEVKDSNPTTPTPKENKDNGPGKPNDTPPPQEKKYKTPTPYSPNDGTIKWEDENGHDVNPDGSSIGTGGGNHDSVSPHRR